MDLLWSTTVPNWVMAITGVIAVTAAIIGARHALVSLRSQQAALSTQITALELDVETRRGDAARRKKGRAHSVRAEWCYRTRTVGETDKKEFGLLITNTNSSPVFDVTLDVRMPRAAHYETRLEPIGCVPSGTVFYEKLSKEPDSEFQVRRMDEGASTILRLVHDNWAVTRVSFILDWEPLEWAYTRNGDDVPTRGDTPASS